MNILRFKNLPIFFKLLLLVSISFLPLLIIFILFISPQIEEQWYDNKYNSTKNTVYAVFNTLEHFHSQIKDSVFTEEDAKAAAAAAIKAQRYEGNNYFWINDMDVNIVAHPLRPEREGKSAVQFEDARGKKVYVEFVNACKSPEGEGFVRYDQNKPGVDEPQPKLSFVKLYKPWGWVIGSGVYLDEVEKNVADFKSSIYKALLIALVIAIGLGFLVGRIVSKPVKVLSEAADKVSNGDINVSVDIDSSDEVGKLADNFNSMVSNIRSNIKEIETKEALANKTALEAKEAKEFAEAQQQYLSESVSIILKEMNKFSEGDLTVVLNSNADDDIGRLFQGFNSAVAKIHTSLTKVVEAVEASSKASSEISLSTETMAAGSQEQTSQTADVATAIEEMTSTIVETTKNSSIAAEKASYAGQIAKEGGNVVLATVEGMNEIAEVVGKAANTVHALGKSSDQIGEIVQVIDDIADQTNLLALNAAIEAARAGEQGRGFAVVADEVRKLAERTTKATKEIASMIKQIQKDTFDAVESMNSGTDKVVRGKELADKAGKALEQIIQASVEVGDVISQVAVAGEEQSKAAEIISQNIESIRSVSEDATQNIHQIAISAEELNELSENLYTLVNEFNLGSKQKQLLLT